MILYMIKFFEREEYADKFLSGELYLNRLSYFQKLEAGNADGRADRNEAVAVWLQPEKVSIAFKDHPELNISPSDLGAPVTIQFERHKDVHLYCMTAMHTGEFECEGNSIICTPETADALRKQLEVDPACLGMGQFAVVVRAREFVERAKDAARAQRYSFSAGLVRYFDPAAFHGHFPIAQIPFMKANEFCHQSEYRIIIDIGKCGDDPLRLSIGSLSDIGAKMPSSALATSFQLRLEPDQAGALGQK